MIKKYVLIPAAMLILLCFCSNAMAAWSFGISTDYTAGDSQAVFNLNLSTDEAIAVGSYGIEFTFDSSELSYVSYTNTAPTGLFPQLFGALNVDQDLGTINSFSAASFAPANVSAGDYLLGSFTFDVSNAVADGATDFNFDYDDPMFLLMINGESFNDDTKALANLTDIAPAAHAPLPAAVWLFGSGIVGLVCFRRKRS